MAAAAPVTLAADFDEQCLRFNELWGGFMRKHFGCAPDAAKLSECKIHRAILALKEFDKAATEGLTLFRPREK